MRALCARYSQQNQAAVGQWAKGWRLPLDWHGRPCLEYLSRARGSVPASFLDHVLVTAARWKLATTWKPCSPPVARLLAGESNQIPGGLDSGSSLGRVRSRDPGPAARSLFTEELRWSAVVCKGSSGKNNKRKTKRPKKGERNATFWGPRRFQKHVAAEILGKRPAFSPGNGSARGTGFTAATSSCKSTRPTRAGGWTRKERGYLKAGSSARGEVVEVN